MRVRGAVLACLLALAPALVGCGDERGAPDPRASSCVAPYLDDQAPGGGYGAPPATVEPGGTLTLHGHWYTSTCDDTGERDPVVALPPVTLTVTFPGGATSTLGPYSPGGRDAGFAAEVEVPPGTPSGMAEVTDGRDGGATYSFLVEREQPLSAPPVVLDLGDRLVPLRPWTACYGNGCFDGAPRPPWTEVGPRDRVRFTFADPGWEFTATFRDEAAPGCGRSLDAPVRTLDDHTFEVTPAGPAGTWFVDLFGRAPGGGDVITTFRWTTGSDGTFPAAATGSAAVLAEHDGELDSYGVEVGVRDLAATPHRATASVTVTAADGTAVTVPTRREHGCTGAGALWFTAPPEVGRRATALGPGPYDYDVTLVLDGTTYRGTGRWPDGESADEAPHVALAWEPALPVYRG